jgi:pimeloyl-ACP methyl ester carboxylesterase
MFHCLKALQKTENSVMRKAAFVALCVLLLASPAWARIEPFPATFKTETIATNGPDVYVRVGGKGPTVVLLHGYGETGDMWAPLAAQVMRAAAFNVTEGIVPHVGHWIMEENPTATIKLVTDFLGK